MTAAELEHCHEQVDQLMEELVRDGPADRSDLVFLLVMNAAFRAVTNGLERGPFVRLARRLHGCARHTLPHCPRTVASS